MTDNLLQKLEEKIMSLLTEVDGLRKEISRLRLENATVANAHGNYVKRLQELVSLLDSMDVGLASEVHETRESVTT